MVYEVRSKRGAVHVKEIDPRTIDAALCVQPASRVMAELLRLYHVDGEADVTEAMAALMRSHIPLVEAFGDETVVTARTTRLRATRDQTSICCRATTDSEQSLRVRSPTTWVSHGNHSRRLNHRANVRFGSLADIIATMRYVR